MSSTIELVVPPAAEWPFHHPLVPPIPPGRVIVHVIDLHEAFVNRQTGNTRLVTTNPVYLLQEWLHAIGERENVTLSATADANVLAEHAPEVLEKRAPFALPIIEISLTRTDASPPSASEARTVVRDLRTLARAVRAAQPEERLRLCIEALNERRTAAAFLVAASTCMEVNDLDAAMRDIEEALALAPTWAAAYFEYGKLWLRRDDLERASEAFHKAATLLPLFTAAWANLGATLGELDRSGEALAAFETALAQDPVNPQALNNVGVARRELGRLDEAETAFRRVVVLAPDRAFGYYNLGHTLFLQGRYQEALSAYVDGQRRDRERNPVQATRLAMCRLATGDASGALRNLREAVSGLPRDYKLQLLADTQTIAWALLTHRPDLPDWKDVSDWLAAELSR